ncbi:uncharacterized protein LY89DRAFT_592692 [Mollisia scopiformis]|uniref:F-box domain-containing protein n=1 Tax=Mollisia scopiformis TaxID=149040 RepID=A0A194WXB5_MOLSC|nr:uncharacterized protein LY89DRAFT_592692 [Mollisia scopiformis]KUJ12319.1 hypothetical protein LY89DRAFT_592692 [Mollisia scopiformis]
MDQLDELGGQEHHLWEFCDEIWTLVLKYIEFDDVFALGQTCKRLHSLLLDDSVCEAILQNTIPYSKEALKARNLSRGYASAFWRAAKRRAAFRAGDPFAVVNLGFANSFLYNEGLLCYLLEDRIRILDLHSSESTETVVNMADLLDQKVWRGPDQNTTVGLTLLHYSSGVLSCCYKQAWNENAWLILIKIETGQILGTVRLHSTEKLFARNNESMLYYGTHSGKDGGPEGHSWEVKCFDLVTRFSFETKLEFFDVSNANIGSTTCFEIYDGYLYAISNRLPVTGPNSELETEQDEWSFYRCRRFPTVFPTNLFCEKATDHITWPRNYQWGPTDTRRTTLNLRKDEHSGALKIVETRMGWLASMHRSQRICYMTDLAFVIQHGLHLPRYPIPYSGSALAKDIFELKWPVDEYFKQRIASLDPFLRDSRPLDKKLREAHRITHPETWKGPPQEIQPCNDQTPHMANKFQIQYYDSASGTFLDIIGDYIPTESPARSHLHLQAQSRRFGPPILDREGHLTPPSRVSSTTLNKIFMPSTIKWWPEFYDSDLDVIRRLLNPPGQLSDVKGIVDERSLVYSAGSRDIPGALIFISFDPAINLAGVEPWKPRRQSKYTAEAYFNDDKATKSSGLMKPQSQRRHDRPGEVVVNETASSIQQGTTTKDMPAPHKWCWKERARYLDVGQGFDFGLR